MPVTIGDVLFRVKQVVSKRLNGKLVLPHHEFEKHLGFTNNGVKNLSGLLEAEFVTEKLALSPGEIGIIAPKTVNDMARAVFDRTKPMPRPKVSKIVIAAVQSVLGPAVGALSDAKKLRAGGLNLPESEIRGFSKEFRAVFFSAIRLEFSADDAQQAQKIGDWVDAIRDQFAKQNR